MSKKNQRGPASLHGELGFYFLANVLPLGASVAGMALVLRLVPPAEFGIFNLVAATASLAATGAGHWLCQWALRHGAAFTAADTRAAYWAVLWRGATAALGAMMIVALAVAALHPGWAALVGATLLLAVTLALQAIFVTVLQGAGRARQYAGALAASTLLRWVCTLLFCLLWKGRSSLWWGLLWGQALGQAGATLLAARSLKGCLSFGFHSSQQEELQSRALSYGAPFLVWAVSMQLLNVADRYVIRGFAGLQAVGVYSAIYSLATAGVMALTNPVLLAFAPRIFQRAGASGSLATNADVRELTEHSHKLLWIIGAPLLVWSALQHREFVTLALGAQYAETTAVFPVVVAGILLWQFSQILQKGFETAAQTGALGSSIVSAVGVNLGLNLLLVPRLGILGAALATLGAYAWYAGLIAVRVARFGRPRIPLRSIRNVLLATAFSSLPLLLSSRLGSELWMRAAACVACLGVYAGALLLLRESILTVPLRSVARALGTR
jgi:O-antigen/teichoic acid export membrane protein